jgi:hypothetical protein
MIVARIQLTGWHKKEPQMKMRRNKKKIEKEKKEKENKQTNKQKISLIVTASDSPDCGECFLSARDAIQTFVCGSETGGMPCGCVP